MERKVFVLQALKPIFLSILFSCIFPFSSSSSLKGEPSKSPAAIDSHSNPVTIDSHFNPSETNSHSNPSETNSHSNPVPKLIVISFDGFRPDYVDAGNTPNLFSLKSNGVFSKRMKSGFTTKTYPNHMSITTGLYEESHGVVHNKMFDPLFNETFDEFNTESKWWFNNKSTPIWIANEKENDGKPRFSGCMMWPGTDVQFRGKLATYVERYKPGSNFTRNVDTIIAWLTDGEKAANLVLAYFDQPDTQAHLSGPFSSQVMQQVRRIDSVFGYLVTRLKALNLFHEVNLILLSDHGMSEVDEMRVIELNDFLPRDKYSMFGASPIWNIIPKKGFEETVFEILSNESKRRNFTVFRKDEVPYEYHYRTHRRILPLVIVADDGYDIIDTKNNLDKERNHHKWGNHGYNNSLPSMRPFFIASGPNFKSEIEIEEDFENIDIYPLMSVVLELFPLNQFPSNGSMKIVSSMLKPVVREAKSGSFFPFLSIFVLAFIGAAICSVCFVFITGLGRPKRQINIHWDPGVTEFDFGNGVTEFDFGNDDTSNGRKIPDAWDGRKIPDSLDGRKIPGTRIMSFPQNAGYSAVSESMLLLDDLDDEEEGMI